MNPPLERVTIPFLGQENRRLSPAAGKEARANLFGMKTFEELVQVMPALSLKTQGWLDKPCAPLLLINGKEDKQVPLEDFYLLLESGNPKRRDFFPADTWETILHDSPVAPQNVGWGKRLAGPTYEVSSHQFLSKSLKINDLVPLVC